MDDDYRSTVDDEDNDPGDNLTWADWALREHLHADEAWKHMRQGMVRWNRWVIAALNGKVSEGSCEDMQMLSGAIAFGWALGATGMPLDKCRALVNKKRRADELARAKRRLANAKKRQAKAAPVLSIFSGGK